MGYGLVVALCALGVLAIYFVSRQRLPLKLERFKGRERLRIEAIHRDFYPGYDLAKVTELWNEIASATEVPPELIRPTDRFDKELGPVKGFELASELDDLGDAVVRHCNERGLDFNEVKIETVDDYVKQFGAPT
jgi:hypothetical protein